jgi:hypothetical protein
MGKREPRTFDDSAEFARGRTTFEERLAAGIAATPLGIDILIPATRRE